MTVDPLGIPQRCAIMEDVSSSEEAKARTAKASRNYLRLKPLFEDAQKELAESIVAERREGELIEDITGRVPYRQTHVNRILKAAGLTEARPRRGDAAQGEVRRTLENMGAGVRERISGRPKFMPEPPEVTPDGN